MVRAYDAALGGCQRVERRHSFRIGPASAIPAGYGKRRKPAIEQPGRQGQPRRYKLDPHGDYIVGLVETKPDLTISDIFDKLPTERHVCAAWATLWTFLDRCGLTFKKPARG